MVPRITIAFVFASILASNNVVVGSEFKGLRIPEEENLEGWIKVEECAEKGIKCKGHADKTEGAGRHCEGGFKQVRSFGIGAKELVEDLSESIRDLHSDMVLSDKKKDSLVPEDILSELMSWDYIDEVDEIFGEEDCSKDGCQKTMKFGGYVKAFWGCNITFSKEGLKMKKDVSCGFKSDEGMGKKEAAFYQKLKEKEL